MFLVNHLCSELFAYLGPSAVGYVMLAQLLSRYRHEAFYFCLAFAMVWPWQSLGLSSLCHQAFYFCLALGWSVLVTSFGLRQSRFAQCSTCLHMLHVYMSAYLYTSTYMHIMHKSVHWAHCRRTLLCSELFAYLGPIAVGYVMLARLLSQYCQEAFHFCLAFDLLWFGPSKI